MRNYKYTNIRFSMLQVIVLFATLAIRSTPFASAWTASSSSIRSSNNKPPSSESKSKYPKPPKAVPPPLKFSHYYFLKEEEEKDGDLSPEHLKLVQQRPTILEERLLSEHAALESYISNLNNSEKNVYTASQEQGNDQDQGNVKTFHTPSSATTTTSTATAVAATATATTATTNRKKENSINNNNNNMMDLDRTVYELNKLLVDTVYKLVCYLYPVSSSSPLSNVPSLIGTEYNDDENEKILRFERFYVLETMARVPYFAYLSVMHLRETFGDRGNIDDTDVGGITDKDIEDNHSDDESNNDNNNNNNTKRITKMRTHYAQADNEFHHLLIMESLGGNTSFVDRSIAHSMAFVYYWYVVAVYAWNEQAAYHLSELVEDHDYNTYKEFLSLHEAELKTRPVPDIARKYYERDYERNPYLFDTFCAVVDNKSKNASTDLPAAATSNAEESMINNQMTRQRRRPYRLDSLYDVFRNVRDDEREHWMALCNLVQYSDMTAVDSGNVKSTTSTSTSASR